MRTLFIFTAFFLSNSVVYSGKESVRLVLLDPIKEEYIEGVKLMDQQGNLIGLSESGIVSVDSKKWENATLRLTHPDYTDTTFQLSQKKGSLFISLTLTSEAHNRWKTFCYPDHTGEYKKLPLDKPDSTAYFQSKDLTSLMRYISKKYNFLSMHWSGTFKERFTLCSL